MSIRVSICVPIYGVEKYIGRCLISLFEQTYKDIEYIFVDDCSPDKSIALLEEVIEQYPQRANQVKVIKHAVNRGLAAARNTAVEKATGSFLLHVDSDDYIETDTVELCLKEQCKNDYDIVSFDVVQHTPQYDRDIVQPPFDDNVDMTCKMLDGRAFHGVCGHLIRTSLYKDHDIYAIEGINMAEDYDVIPKLTFYASKVCNLHRLLYHYCFNQASYTKNFSHKSAEQQLAVNHDLGLFFQSKDSRFLQIINRKRIITLLNHLRYSSLSKDKAFYEETLKHLDHCEKETLRQINKMKTLPYYIRNRQANYFLFSLTSYLNRFYKRLKYRR